MADSGSYETTVDVNAPVQEVFRHLTDPAAMIRWMGQHATRPGRHDPLDGPARHAGAGP